MKKRAAPKDREYLEGLNLKQLQKTQKPAADQNKREFYQELQQEAKKGPLFEPWQLKWVDGLPALGKPVTQWLMRLSNVGALENMDPRQLNLIVDWVNGDPAAGAQLPTLSWEDAFAAQEVWHQESHQQGATESKYRTHDMDEDFGGGWHMVVIKDEADLKTEGDLMQHCVGGYWNKVERGDSIIYSLRDPQDHPHITVEVNPREQGGHVNQIYGFKNNPPSSKYNKYLAPWLRKHKYISGLVLLTDYELTPEDTQLALSGSAESRYALATRTSKPELLRALSESLDHDTLWAVADNKATPPDVLEKLAVHDEHEIRVMVARNASTSSHIIHDILSNDADEDVLRAILRWRSADASPQVIITLAKLSHPIAITINVVEGAVHNKNVFTLPAWMALAKSPSLDFRAIAAQSCPYSSVLSKLDHDSAWEVRFALAENKHIAEATVHALANDKDDNIVTRLVSNPAVPELILYELATKVKGKFVFRDLLTNPNTSTRIRNLVNQRVQDE